VEILFIAPEIVPYSHSGEVGEVCAALPKALRSVGHKVTVISPLWAGVDATARSLARRLSGVDVYFDSEKRGEKLTCTLFDGRTTGGVDLVFVSQPELFGKATAGDESVAGMRAAIGFAQAAAAVAANRSPTPEVIHAHGFFAAAALPLCATTLPAATRVLSLYDSTARGLLDGATRALVPAALQELAGGAQASLLRIGVDGAQRVVARSPGEAARLLEQQPQHDGALGPTLAGKLTGIANGLDAARWNPTTDALLPARFDAMSPGGKARCKDALQLERGLSIRPELPLVLCPIGSSKTAAALLCAALPGMLRNDVQVIVLGEAVEGDAALFELRGRYEDRLALSAAVDERTLHRAVAGADLLLALEHGGRAGDLHLVGQRLGALPIGPRGTAIADGLVDCDASLETGTGFLFEAGSASELAGTVQRACSGFMQADAFARLRTRVMRLDLSWERSARHFEHLYKLAAPTPA
jgi:starch synthase